MKQNITINQWNELSHKQKDKLDNYHDEHTWEMNIGQMIEFLNDNKRCYSIEMMHNNSWTIDEDRELPPANQELADDLWEAVKEVLEQ